MSDLPSEADLLMQALVSDMHRGLVDKFSDLVQSRELSDHESSVLGSLHESSPQYQQLIGLLAIEAYTTHTIKLFVSCEPILEILALLLKKMYVLRDEINALDGEKSPWQVFDDMWNELKLACEISQQMFPKSPTVDLQEELLKNDISHDCNYTIYTRLIEENEELKSKLQQTDQHILYLEIKLAKILHEHENSTQQADGDSGAAINGKENYSHHQLAGKEAEIIRMNEEFATEIDKYNVVYESMKREIQYLREYKEMDLVDYVERLETDTVKLREEKERDEILINELRTSQFKANHQNTYGVQSHPALFESGISSNNYGYRPTYRGGYY